MVEGLSGGLKGVDAAELGTARGESARRAMVALVAGTLTCELTGEKTHGREVGYCFTSGGLDIKPACNGKRDPRPRLGQRVANVIWKGSMLAYAYGNAAPTQSTVQEATSVEWALMVIRGLRDIAKMFAEAVLVDREIFRKR